MTRARLWIAGALFALGRKVVGSTPDDEPRSVPDPEPDDEPLPAGSRPFMTEVAREMLADGERRAREMLPTPKEAPKPRGGSLAARNAAARDGRTT